MQVTGVLKFKCTLVGKHETWIQWFPDNRLTCLELKLDIKFIWGLDNRETIKTSFIYKSSTAGLAAWHPLSLEGNETGYIAINRLD